MTRKKPATTFSDLEKFLRVSGCRMTAVYTRNAYVASISRDKFSIGSSEAPTIEEAILEALEEARNFINTNKN